MPPIRSKNRETEEDELVASGADEDDEEDDMPPLVDQPLESSQPPTTYTFFTDIMTPYHSQLHLTMTPDSGPDQTVPPLVDQDTPTYILPPRTTNHGKRRDASYIPRPPNAFILFRASFIRSQQITGKVEGNHSNLSKIIGRIWKTLPKSERDQWEAKAKLAQAEHRNRYPDWRFRPGANALAKLKIPDPGGTSKPKRIRSSKDPPDPDPAGVGAAAARASLVEYKFEDSTPPVKTKGKGKEKGSTSRSQARGRGRSERRVDENGGEEDRAKEVGRKESEERRIAKIADFLVEGKKGVELEVAVQEWERGRKVERRDEREHVPYGSPGHVPASIGYTTIMSSGPSSASTSAAVSPVTSLYNAIHSPTSVAWIGSGPSSPHLTHIAHSSESQPTTGGDSRPPSILARRRRSPSPPHAHSQDVPRRRPFNPTHPRPSPLQVQVDVQASPEIHSGDSLLHSWAHPPPSADVEERPAPGPYSAPLPYKRSSSAPATDRRPPLPTSAVPAETGSAAATSASSTPPSSQPPVSSPSAPHSARHQVPPTHTIAPELRPPHPSHSRRDTISLPLHHHWGTPSSFHGDFSSSRAHNLSGSPTTVSSMTTVRLPWQEEEDRRREEIEFGCPIWRTSRSHSQDHEQADNDSQGDFEPIREGNFEVLIGGDAGVKGYPGGGSSEAFSAQPTSRPPPPPTEDNTADWNPHPGSFGLSHTNLEVAYEDYAPALSPVERLSYPSSSINVELDVGASPFPSYLSQNTYSPTESLSISPSRSQATRGHSDPGLGEDTTPPQQQHMFYPQAPNRLSPHTPISTFSSLAGWDGEPARDVATPSPVRSAAASPWYESRDGRGGVVQPMGLHGGGRGASWDAGDGGRYNGDGGRL